jgi:hypothetical protein
MNKEFRREAKGKVFNMKESSPKMSTKESRKERILEEITGSKNG